jgi:aspartyl-tRNA(Asn)/glutamyl-tRNA(Gln) amidotransferase subunit A
MQAWFRDFDFLLCPSIGPAAKLVDIGARDKSRALVSFTSPFNHTYNPAAAIPFGFHSSGLPLGVQVVGRLRDDVGVLRMSAAFEKANPWAHHWPALADKPSLARI